jgi:hypothetical protein
MHKGGWAWRAAASLTAFGALVACSGGRTLDSASCDGGSCDGGTGAFPYIGPSCSTAEFPAVCWGCVQSACPTTESCLSTACGDYFNCYCACAAGNATCQASCPQTAACQNCAQNITKCQVESCPAQCGAEGGAPQTTCATLRSCPNGGALQSCSVTDQGLCQSQYYTIGSQTFPCAACGNCASAATTAGTACP